MKRGGKGGTKTARNGLLFEKRVSLKEVFKRSPKFSVHGNTVFYKGKKVAELFPKFKLYKDLLEKHGVDCRKIISKRLLPDDAILVLKNRTLFIVEIKFQEVPGSVDEKLQTCDFKNKEYKKLLSPLKIKVKYVYVLNDWFKQEQYRDVLKYVKSVGCFYFFYFIPFKFLSL